MMLSWTSNVILTISANVLDIHKINVDIHSLMGLKKLRVNHLSPTLRYVDIRLCGYGDLNLKCYERGHEAGQDIMDLRRI